MFNYSDTAHFFEYFRQHVADTYPSGIFEAVSVDDMFEANTSKYFERNTENLVRGALSARVRPVLMPFLHSAEPAGAFYFEDDSFELRIEEHNSILRKVADRYDLAFIDLRPIFPKDKQYWFKDGLHVNSKGAQLKAKLVADALFAQNLIPKSQ